MCSFLNEHTHPTLRWLHLPNYDGKDYPAKGAPAYDTVAMTRVDAFRVEVTRKKAGKVVQSGTRVASKDGKILTVTYTGTDAQGRRFTSSEVYEKQ